MRADCRRQGAYSRLAKRKRAKRLGCSTKLRITFMLLNRERQIRSRDVAGGQRIRSTVEIAQCLWKQHRFADGDAAGPFAGMPAYRRAFHISELRRISVPRWGDNEALHPLAETHHLSQLGDRGTLRLPRATARKCHPG